MEEQGMIFVTVGTHEQPFNRLVKCMDYLKRDGVITEEIVIQTGFSTYKPKYCVWSNMFTYKNMVENVEKSHIVITHGGPSSIILSLQFGKVPIVVPRQKQFGEHVNDHQVEFVRQIAMRQGNVITIEDIKDLKKIILGYDSILKSMKININRNNAAFNTEFEKIIDEIFKGKA